MKNVNAIDCGCCGGAAPCEPCKYRGCDQNNKGCTELLLDESRGIYIPQAFASECEPERWGISEEDARVLRAGPQHEYYWDVWDDVLASATLKRKVGKVVETWVLHQDGDLWAQLVEVGGGQ